MEKQSTILCDILDNIGATGAVRKWMRDVASTFSELHKSVYFNLTENFSVVVGSLSEGTYRKSYKSDVDVLFFYGDIKLYESKSLATEENYCIFEYIDSKSGYVYLNVHGNKTEDGITITKILPSGKKLLQGLQEKEFLSKISFKNGPALASGTSGLFELDIVFCVHSPWPSVANEWFNRQRPYNWPSEETQQILKDLPCIVVQTAHPDTPEHEKDKEWRLSFTLQENHIMCNLNDTQYKCYVLLKMVKHDLITVMCGESLTSYHCKTALFYTMEQFPEAIWRPEKLIQCLVLCLLRLCLWATVEFCPQYFMYTVDLFHGKIDKQLMPKICETLQNIIKNPVESLKKLNCSNSGKMFTIKLSETECVPEWRILEEKAKQEMILLVVETHKYFRTLFSFMHIHVYNLYSEVSGQDKPPLSSLIKRCLNKIESYRGKKFFLYNTVPSLNAFLASTLVAKSFKSDNHIERDWLFGAAALYFMYALDGNNNIAARLRLANVLYATGHRESAASILDKVKSIIETYSTPSMTQKEVKTMPMFGRFVRYIWDMGQTDMNAILSTPMYTMLNMFPEFKIIFDINEIEIVPKCFVFELFKNLGTTLPLSYKIPQILDAVNFHMYLTYLVNGNCESLQNSLLYEAKPIAFYVLGWRERERGYHLRAAQYFYQSWKEHEEDISKISHDQEMLRHIRPVCAAKLHLLVLTYEIWRDSKELLTSA